MSEPSKEPSLKGKKKGGSKKEPLGMGLAAILKSTLDEEAIHEERTRPGGEGGGGERLGFRRIGGSVEIVIHASGGGADLLLLGETLPKKLDEGEYLSLFTREERRGAARKVNNLGLESLQKEDYDKSVAYFRKALLWAPEEPRYPYHLALAYDGKEEYGKAIEFYKKAVENSPNDTDIRNNLAIAYYNNDQRQEAITQFEEILKREADNELARENLEMILGEEQ